METGHRNQQFGAIYLVVWMAGLLTFLPFPGLPTHLTGILLLASIPVGLICGGLLTWRYQTWRRTALVFTGLVLVAYAIRWLSRIQEAMDRLEWALVAQGISRNIKSLLDLISQFIHQAHYAAALKLSYFEIVMPIALLILFVLLAKQSQTTPES